MRSSDPKQLRCVGMDTHRRGIKSDRIITERRHSICGSGMPSTQKRIRDLQRLLNRQKKAVAEITGSDDDDNKLSDVGTARELHRAAEKVKVVEEQLSEAQQQRQQIAMQEKERKNAKKYHMVRFLERKKLTKLIHRLELQRDEGQNDRKSLETRIAHLREDLAYILYYPLQYKYIALFPNSSHSTESTAAADHDTAQLKKQCAAREVALQRWAKEKGTESDKVAHAMAVEYGTAIKEKCNSGSKESNRKRDRASLNDRELDHGAADRKKKRKLQSLRGVEMESPYGASSKGNEEEGMVVQNEGKDVNGADTTQRQSKARSRQSSGISADSFFLEETVEGEEEDDAAHPNKKGKKQRRADFNSVQAAVSRRKFQKHKRIFNKKALRQKYLEGN